MISSVAVAVDVESDGGRLIEIGLTTLDWRRAEIMQSYSLAVHPREAASTCLICGSAESRYHEDAYGHDYKAVPIEVSEHVRQLTGWDNARLAKVGLSKMEIVRRMIDLYGMRNRLIISDASDEAGFIEEALGTKLSEHRINVAILFALRHRIEKSPSLEQMLVASSLTFEGRAHDAKWDSLNIARLFLALV